MGLWPTRSNENQRRPRESGDPFSVRNTMDSRLRGNDVVFGGAAGDEESRSALKASQSEILRGFYPEHPERDPSLRSG